MNFCEIVNKYVKSRKKSNPQLYLNFNFWKANQWQSQYHQTHMKSLLYITSDGSHQDI